MNLSWKIGTVFGIPVRLHITMLLLPMLMYDPQIFSDARGLLIWAGFIVLIFGSVLLHELGHALTARRYGIRTQDIILTPIGGIARIMNMPETPRQEIAIAIAGPLVSVGLAGLAFALTTPVAMLTNNQQIVYGLSFVFYINGVLGIFNLIPALPMDGGRVLRGILALRRDHLTATRIAVKVGRTLAVIGAISAFLWFENTMNIVLISGFIYLMAGTELRQAEIKAVRERMAREGAHRSPPQGNQPWPWNVYTRQAGQAPGNHTGAEHAQESNAEPPVESWEQVPKDGWSTRQEQRENRDVLVVKGGKVEILSRKDPEKK